MSDILLESLRAVILGVTFIALILGHRSGEVRHVKGWKTLMTGFALIFFGTLIDITDNFTELNRFVIVGDTPAQAFLEKVVGYLLGFMMLAVGFWQWLPRLVEHQKLIAENLEKAKKEVKYLQGLLPICASCKKIRDDKGYWKQIETYVAEYSEAKFSHSICPACAEKLYPDYYKEITPQAAPADAARCSARPRDDDD